MRFSRAIQGLFCLPGIVLALAVTAQDIQPGFQWQAYDESREINEQASHDNPRMQFRLLNSRLLDKNTLWRPIEEELAIFSETEYLALKPLIMEKNIPAIQEAVISGQLSYEQLVKFYLYRIRLIESDNSRSLNAIIAVNPEAILQARDRDRLYRDGEAEIDTHSVFGIPVLLKDNIGFAPMATSAGAAVLQNNMAPDAFITQRLRDHGAIILGKANLSEWAYYFCDGCPLGYSAVGGQTLNPYGRKQLESGGSSSGSAVAVAANLVAVAVGTETSGSILSPSGLNSVVGFKPTTGVLSRSGIVPISSTLDTPGPITRHVIDAVILLNAMSGYDETDQAMPRRSQAVALTSDVASVAGLRLGYLSELQEMPPYQAGVDALRNAGAEMVEIELPEYQLQGFGDFLGAEMKVDLPRYLENYTSETIRERSVSDIRHYNNADSELRAPYGQGRFDAMDQAAYSETELTQWRSRLQQTATSTLDLMLRENRVVAFLSISNFHAGIAALANYPAITVPMGALENGQPLGMTFIAPGFSEQLLTDLALVFERLTQARILPANYQ